MKVRGSGRSPKLILGAIVALIASVTAEGVRAADGPHVNAGDVKWTAPPESYSGAAFAEAFRYKTLVGGENSPVQGKNVYFGEAEFAPGAVYVGHNHPSPEVYYVISGEAKWTVDGKTFKATPGTAIYAKPYAVHRMINVGGGVLKTVWMWWGDPEVTSQFPKLVEPVEDQPAGAKFAE